AAPLLAPLELRAQALSYPHKRPRLPGTVSSIYTGLHTFTESSSLMQRRAVLVFSLMFLVCLVIAGCGGGSSSSNQQVATSIVIAPSPANVEQGRVLPLT